MPKIKIAIEVNVRHEAVQRWYTLEGQALLDAIKTAADSGDEVIIKVQPSARQVGSCRCPRRRCFGISREMGAATVNRLEMVCAAYLQMLQEAVTEENTLAVVNGGVEAAIQALAQYAAIEDPAVRREMVTNELDYIRGVLDAYTKFRINKTFRAELSVMREQP